MQANLKYWFILIKSLDVGLLHVFCLKHYFIPETSSIGGIPLVQIQYVLFKTYPTIITSFGTKIKLEADPISVTESRNLLQGHSGY
jgi:hypothetical protein